MDDWLNSQPPASNPVMSTERPASKAICSVRSKGNPMLS